MALFAAIGPIVSGIASIAGAAISAAAMSQQANAEQQAAAWNAARQREEAAWAQSKGAQDSAQRAQESDQAAAKARAAQAQSGISTTEGSPLLLQQDFADKSLYSQQVAMANATKTQRDFENKAKITEWEGEVRANSSMTAAAGTLLSGVAGGVKSFGSAMAAGGGSAGNSGGFGVSFG